MNKIYTLKKNLKIPEDLKSIDSKKREKVEAILGRKFEDWEWDTYKNITRDRQKN